MNMDAEWNRLCGMYAAKDDEELLALWRSRKDFTELAQQAIEKGVKERRLTPPGEAMEDEDAAPGGGGGDDVGENETMVYAFKDTYDLTSAVGVLEEAGVPYRILDKSRKVSVGLRSSRTISLWLVVRRKDQARAETLLHEAMGLFPGPESDDMFAELAGFRPVGMFERADAVLVAQALAAAGMSYVWKDSRDDLEAEGDVVAIDVLSKRVERAMELAQACFAGLPESVD